MRDFRCRGCRCDILHSLWYVVENERENDVNVLRHHLARDGRENIVRRSPQTLNVTPAVRELGTYANLAREET